MDLLPLFFQSISVAQIFFQGSSSWYCNESKCLSYFIPALLINCLYLQPHRWLCIWGVSDLEQAMSALLGIALRAWAAHMLACVLAVWETAGVHHAQVGVVTEVIVSPVRRRYMILLVTQKKGHCGMGGRRNLFKEGICAVCCGKTSPGSAWCCINVGFPASGGM